MPKMDRRRRYDFNKFREQLEQLTSEEIRERLNTNRIRSTERRAWAEELLRERARAGEAGRVEGTERAARASATKAARMAEEAGQGSRDTFGARRADTEHVRQRKGREDLPTVRQLGCVLCLAAMIGAMTILAAGLLRR
ncbi:hypothetical protein [Ferruginivarius sediminum]|uniref:Uncharacterized protein n=1 Tax=Ferruginivarius sediminum TaxID=2661937 RepID=A0A369TLF2_9PROT|nr:hypothetical protein [Ferruginivarius sediminum]RDD63726.1 hypothetical protein DRB17_00665 [Ferruginivarius sediminum]